MVRYKFSIGQSVEVIAVTDADKVDGFYKGLVGDVVDYYDRIGGHEIYRVDFKGKVCLALGCQLQALYNDKAICPECGRFSLAAKQRLPGQPVRCETPRCHHWFH